VSSLRISSFRRGAAPKTPVGAATELSSNGWYPTKIIERDKHVEGYLNGKKLLEDTDDLFTKAGGVGLWTKADAVTSFDDFSVLPYKEENTTKEGLR